jgi:hypothetical protein
MDERSNDRTNGRTNHERSDERTNKLRTGGRTTERSLCPSIYVGNGVLVWEMEWACGGEESCHEMAWGGMRGGPCPSIYSHGGGIRGRMRGLVGD